MGKTITPKQIRINNKQLIYTYIYEQPKVSQQDISYALRLSRPTVTTNLAELENEGLIFRDGQIESDLIGRKAIAYSVVPDYRISIGVEITDSLVKVMAVDLYGKKIVRKVLEQVYETSETYVKEVCAYINQFIADLNMKKEQILGIGFAVQGLTSSDGTKILYGKILKNSGVNISSYRRYLDYPCSFIHDAESAAICELWESPEIKNAFFMLLSYHLGAAQIYDGKVENGKHGHSATIEHITIMQNGKMCYCGKKGCAETILSMNALLEGRDVEDFFQKVRAEAEEESTHWKKYLKKLALAINNIHLIYDSIFLLSGYLAVYMTEADIQYLYQEIAKITPFEEPNDFIQISKMPKHSITIGAALPYISRFLENIAG